MTHTELDQGPSQSFAIGIFQGSLSIGLRYKLLLQRPLAPVWVLFHFVLSVSPKTGYPDGKQSIYCFYPFFFFSCEELALGKKPLLAQ